MPCDALAIVDGLHHLHGLVVHRSICPGWRLQPHRHQITRENMQEKVKKRTHAPEAKPAQRSEYAGEGKKGNTSACVTEMAVVKDRDKERARESTRAILWEKVAVAVVVVLTLAEASILR